MLTLGFNKLCTGESNLPEAIQTRKVSHRKWVSRREGNASARSIIVLRNEKHFRLHLIALASSIDGDKLAHFFFSLRTIFHDDECQRRYSRNRKPEVTDCQDFFYSGEWPRAFYVISRAKTEWVHKLSEASVFNVRKPMRTERASFTAWLNVHLRFCIKLCIMTTALLWWKSRQTLIFLCSCQDFLPKCLLTSCRISFSFYERSRMNIALSAWDFSASDSLALKWAYCTAATVWKEC